MFLHPCARVEPSSSAEALSPGGAARVETDSLIDSSQCPSLAKDSNALAALSDHWWALSCVAWLVFISPADF